MTCPVDVTWLRKPWPNQPTQVSSAGYYIVPIKGSYHTLGQFRFYVRNYYNPLNSVVTINTTDLKRKDSAFFQPIVVHFHITLKVCSKCWSFVYITLNCLAFYLNSPFLWGGNCVWAVLWFKGLLARLSPQQCELYPELIQVASGTETELSPRARVGPHSIFPPKPYIVTLKIPLNGRTNGGRFRIFQQKWF